QEEVATHEAQRRQLEAALAMAQEQLAMLKSARDIASQAASEMAAELAAVEERRRSAQASLQRIESLATEVESHIHSLQSQIASAIAEKDQRERENVEIVGRLDALASERQDAEAKAA